MKKLLSMFLIAGALVACNDSKKDDPKTGDSTKIDEKKSEDVKPADEKKPEDTKPADDKKTDAGSTSPLKFADSEAQKLADDYRAFMNGYDAAMKEPAKADEFTKQIKEWEAKLEAMSKKLSSNDDEFDKWTDFMDEMNSKKK